MTFENSGSAAGTAVFPAPAPDSDPEGRPGSGWGWGSGAGRGAPGEENGREGAGGGGAASDQGSGAAGPVVPVGRIVDGTTSRAVRLAARRRLRTAVKTRWCMAWLSRKRTSVLVG